MKKTLIFLLTVLSLCGLIGCQGAQKEDVHVFFTSDVHCGVNENVSFGGLMSLIKERKEQKRNVLLVDCGDNLQGGTLGSMTKGEAIVDLMNEMGYDVATLGNHDFDYGMERLRELLNKAEYTVLNANMSYTGNKKDLFADLPAYVIKSFGATKVAFVGVLTPESPTSSTPAFFKEDGKIVYDFCAGEDGMRLARRVQEAVDKARKEGADYVVVISHLGSIAENYPNDSITLISHTHGIDAVLDGHSHSVVEGIPYPNDEGKDVLLASVGTKLEYVGELILSKDGISAVLYSEVNEKDEETEALVNASFQKLDDILSQHLAHSSFDLPITNSDNIRISRSRECTLGNLLCDMLMEKYGTDVAVLNGGAIRKTVSAGEITYNDALNVLPFGNMFAVVKASGQMILDCLEFGAQKTENAVSFEGNPVGEFGGFIQVGGLKYGIDTSIPSPVVLDENAMLSAIEGKRRVYGVQVLVDGKYEDIDPEKLYTVAGGNYVLLNDGDGNTAFHDAEVLDEGVLLDLDVFCEYLRNTQEIPARYEQAEGRISVK